MEKWEKLKKFTRECIRVFKVTRKPDKEEYKVIVKVTGLGIAAIGTIGLILQMMNQIFLP